ncbi:MAG: hypothetical protein WDN47_00105 [Candidatus Doudnabacteria bacterium]
MRPIVSEKNHKYLSTFIVSFGMLLGFEALSYIVGIYQLNTGLFVAFYVYAFHIFWLTFLFDLHLKKRSVLAAAGLDHKGAQMVWNACKERVRHVFQWEYFRHYQNYLVLPGLLYWATVILIFLNPFNTLLKQSVIFSASIAMTVAYWFIKEHFSKRLEAQYHWITVLALVKLFTAFLIYSAVIGVTFHYGYDVGFLLPAVVTITFLLVYQALFQHNLLSFPIFIWIVILALVMGIVSVWVYNYWNTEYFTAGLVMVAVYNMLWGILHHYLDKTLTQKVVFEYLAMMILIISFLFASHNFNQRVI